MIEIKTIGVWGFEGAIRGMRFPYESNSKSDSRWVADCSCSCPYFATMECDSSIVDKDSLCPTKHYGIGEADMALCKKLIKGGSEHRKFLRMIHVQADVKIPSYIMAELATYKIGTTMNSSSLQHLGAKRDYTIRDFAIDDDRIYEILDWKPTDHKNKHPLIFSENGADEYKLYQCGDRTYKVFKNGKIVRCAFDIEDNGLNRIRHFEEKEIKFTQNSFGYYQCNLGGRRHIEKWMVHRLIAMLWHPETFSPELTVNHIDHQKGNNHADNLEWVTLYDNIKDQNENGLNPVTLHKSYVSFKKSMKLDPSLIYAMKQDFNDGMNISEIARKYNISQGQSWTLLKNDSYLSENRELFLRCYIWEKLLDEINSLRRAYEETKDYSYFRVMRQIMPQSFIYHIMWDANYEVLLNIYRQRKNHRLSEWHTFCEWALELPYFEEFLEVN